MNEVIKVTNLYKTHNGKQAVNGLSLFVQKGSVFGLLGANGTDTLHTIWARG